jgi:hypothetical protein
MLRRNCVLKHVTDRNIEGRKQVMGRQGRRRKQPLNNLKKMRGYSKLKEEALYCFLWKTCFARDYGPLIREKTTAWSYKYSNNYQFPEKPATSACSLLYNLCCLWVHLTTALVLYPINFSNFEVTRSDLL